MNASSRAKPRFSFFCGKGGVGKTTCAAAAAVRAAREGASVLVVSTDPAHSLGDALAHRLGRRPRKIAPRLFAAELDADRALTRWLRGRRDAFRTIAERGTYLDEEDVDRLLDLSLPGVDEIVGLVELFRLARTVPCEEVVVDTAPTGHTLRLLEMPTKLARFAEVLDGMQAKHRFLASSLGGRYAADFADDAIARIERSARDIAKSLRDPRRTSFTWVTLLERLAIAETKNGISALRTLGIAVPRVVANRVIANASQAKQLRDLDAFFAGAILAIPVSCAEPRGVAALARLAETVAVARPLVVTAPRLAPGPSVRAKPLGIEGRRLVFFGGKGGVGKTTASTAFALELAASRRVLLLSTDPAHSLGDVLGRAVGDDPATVDGLVVRELDGTRAFAHEQSRYREAIDATFAAIFGRLDATFDRQVLHDLLDLAPPGVDEIFALLAIVDALDDFATVVVDTAPTGHTLRLLALPAKMRAWVHAVMQITLKYRHVVGLGDFARDLTVLAGKLRALGSLLQDPERTAFVIVTRGGELSRRETTRLEHTLSALGIATAAILQNGGEPRTTRRVAASWEAPSAPDLVGAPALRRWRARWKRYDAAPKWAPRTSTA